MCTRNQTLHFLSSPRPQQIRTMEQVLEGQEIPRNRSILDQTLQKTSRRRKKDGRHGSSSKPEVILEIMTNDGKQLQFDALIDPGSYSVDNSGSNDNVSNSNIVSYISESLATKIKDKILENNTNKCTCTPSKTCTPTGCFISTSCLTVTGRLKDSLASTDEIQK